MVLFLTLGLVVAYEHERFVIRDARATTVVRLLEPRTVVSSPDRIRAFAQDGDRIAWVGGECKVEVLDLRSRARTVLPSGKNCHGFGAGSPLALAGDRVLWKISDASNAETWGYFVTATLGDRGERRLCKYNAMADEDHQPVFAAAGDRGLLAFTMKGDKIEGSPICDGLWLVSRGRARRAAARASTLLAVGGARIASARTASEGGCRCNVQPVWSPDGSKVAFSSGRAGSSEIYVVDADGRNERRIGRGHSPAWSSNGGRLAFARWEQNGSSRVVTVEPDGTGERVVGAGTDPRWSPDGARLVLQRELGGEREAIVVVEDGGGERSIFEDVALGAPTWSPDGRWVAFTSAAGGGRTRVVSFDGRIVREIGRESVFQVAPSWSPDGTRVLVNSGLEGIYALNADGSGETRLSSGLDIDPAWSPDGTRIAFVRGTYDPATDGVENPRVWVMNENGTGARRLTGAASDEWDPQWSPRGDEIVLGQGELFVSAADGSGGRRLTRTTPAEARSTVELRGASGRLLRTVDVPGRAEAVALSQSRLALLVAGFFGRRVAFYDPATGASRGTLPVPPSTAPELSIAGTDAVFRVRNTIYLADARRLVSRALARAKSIPLGLSIEGRRVAWAETGSSRNDRIQSITLPRG